MIGRSFTKPQLYNLCKLAKLSDLASSEKGYTKKHLIDKICEQRFKLQNPEKLKAQKEKENKQAEIKETRFLELGREDIFLFFNNQVGRDGLAIGGKSLADRLGVQVNIVRAKQEGQELKKVKGKGKGTEKEERFGLRLEGSIKGIERISQWFRIFEKVNISGVQDQVLEEVCSVTDSR